ncbi:hypothetical protein GCM10020331_036050 [Ectobacillus funiculus]
MALPYLQRATELNETDAEAMFQYGLCLARLEYVKEAKPMFEKKAVALDPDHADAYYNLGVVYVFEENAEKKALEMFKKRL